MADKVQKIKEFLIGMAGAACCDAKTKKNIETIILPFVDSLQKEPASEDLKKFAEEWDESLYRSDAVIAGANWQKNLNKKDFELLKEWFEDISEKCEHLTSGNVSHNGKMIRGYARNCAEYIKTDLL